MRTEKRLSSVVSIEAEVVAGPNPGFFKGGSYKKTLKTNKKIVYIHFCYIFHESDKHFFLGGGGLKPPLPTG